MRFKSFGFCENSSKSGEMRRLCWVVLFATGVLGFEESPVFLEWLVDPSAEETSGKNKKAKMTAQKSNCRRTQRDLLNSFTGWLTLLGSTVRSLHFHISSLPRVPVRHPKKYAVRDGRLVIVMLKVATVNNK